MENFIKNNIQGEIFIPLSNYYKKNENENINIKNIFDCNYKSFRSTVFTNEYLHFFLILIFESEIEDNVDIDEINEFINNNCEINIQYFKKFKENENENDIKKLKHEINYTITDEIKDIKNVNNGILKNCEIIKEKKMIIYELYSRIELKEENNNYNENNSKIDMNISITTSKKNKLNDDIDIKDIHIINYININNNNYINNNKKHSLFNINKTLDVVNPLKISSINQYDSGNNRYLLSIKLENIIYKINFKDDTLKNSKILKKGKNMQNDDNEFLSYEFPITIANIYINEEKNKINDILFLNFLKFEQERNKEGKFDINKKRIKFIILNNQFPIIINPKEIYNLVIEIQKNYDYLIINDKNNKINQLIKLNISTPVCVNILSDKSVNNLIWNFAFKWKDELNNKLNIEYKIEKINEIKIYNFFKVYFSIIKLHNQKIKFEFRFNDSYEDFKLRNKKNPLLPDIFPEKKSFIVEMNENEHIKSVEFKYIPIKKDYVEFPPFEIFDFSLNKIYLVFFTNKIYVNS